MIQTVAVIGSGAMGTGIGQVAATHQCTVIFCDASAESLEHSRHILTSSIERMVEKGKLTGEAGRDIIGRCRWTSDMKEIAGADLIIEAIVEKFEAKEALFKAISEIIPDQTIVATNTSSLSITALAATISHPERFIGLHFFNPAPIMRLVEIVPALQTEKTLIEKMQHLMASWAKTAVVARNTPGFIVNRVARPFYGEALRIFDEGLAGCRAIDTAMKEVGGFRMGPFELMDFIGHDVNYRVTESVYNAMFQDPRYKPSLTQKSLLDAGWLGRKTGRGFYAYPDMEETMTSYSSWLNPTEIFGRIFAMLVNEAVDAVYMNICSEEDVENAMQLGTNYPQGLISWGRTFGMDRIMDIMSGLYERYREDRYRPSPLLTNI